MSEIKVSVIGLGYIGLPTASLIASKGVKVNGYDNNEDVINNIHKLSIDENEPSLIKMTSKVLNNKQLYVSTNLISANFYIITVPTPLKIIDKKRVPDVSFVFQAIDEIVKLLKPNDTIILESTCPPGTTENIYKSISQQISFINLINIAYCPERILPGNLLNELQNNDRIVGGINNRSSKKAKEFYKIFCNGNIHQSNSLTAELVKLAENSYRDVNIAFANSLSLIAEKSSIPVNDIIKLSNFHPRVNILQSGIGVGGHCIPVDPWFLIDKYPDETKLLSEARKINDFKTNYVLNFIMDKIDSYEVKYNKKPSIICLGLSYKVDSNDLRESPA
ncbi:nucleotide sugar dehydrogenase, partial [Alphaproteobacteria bacterium]|nr:nucleotide sugar dehydrogenase [Alphaproteobacteria bacterium]